MSRILEFQPTDEQTVVARVLVEVHQAIDFNFPNAQAGAKQFTKTVLTNNLETTRIDNVPPSNSDRKKNANVGRSDSGGSLTSGQDVNHEKNPLTFGTADIRTLLGESANSRRTMKLLLILLTAGVIVFIWINFIRGETFPD